MISKIRAILKRSENIRLIIIKIKYFLNSGLERDAEIIKKMNFNTSVDVGANNGYYTNLLLGVSKKVISFEPIHYLYKLNLRLFKNKNVVIYNVALGDKETFGKLNIPQNNDPESSLVNKFKNSIVQKVRITTGDKLLKKIKKIDFIKIDVEGYEIFVLKGLKKTIYKSLPIFLIEIEKKHNKDYKKVFEHMNNLNYKIFYLDITKKLKLIKLENVSKFIKKNQSLKKNSNLNYMNNFWFINIKSPIFYLKDNNYF